MDLIKDKKRASHITRPGRRVFDMKCSLLTAIVTHGRRKGNKKIMDKIYVCSPYRGDVKGNLEKVKR